MASFALRLFFSMLAMVTNLASGTKSTPFRKSQLSLRRANMNSTSGRVMAFHAAALNNATLALAYLSQQPCVQTTQTVATFTAGITCPPEAAGCTPVCKWHCTTPQCAEVCEPECDAPRCDVRCTHKETSGCNFNCAQPSCAVICPSAKCSQSNCPKCNALCGAPKCTLDCAGYQPCHSVCEQPTCKWNCKKPEVCPEPKCSMVCESPKACPDMSTHMALPPVGNEYVVSSFNIPHSPACEGPCVSEGVTTPTFSR